MKRPRKFNVTCIDCGEVFSSAASTALRCPVCRAERKREVSRQQARDKRKHRTSSAPTVSLEAITKEIKEYNQKHNTHLTYGKYILLKGCGLLKG